jgi:hypothetical protein
MLHFAADGDFLRYTEGSNPDLKDEAEEDRSRLKLAAGELFTRQARPNVAGSFLCAEMRKNMREAL